MTSKTATEFVQANVDEITNTLGDRARRLEGLRLRKREKRATEMR